MPSTVGFQDGPCAGKVESVPDSLAAIGKIQCGGKVYYLTQTGSHTFAASVHEPSTPTNPLSIAPDLFGGWDDLRHSLADRLKPALHAARQNDLAALRSLSRHSRLHKR